MPPPSANAPAPLAPSSPANESNDHPQLSAGVDAEASTACAEDTRPPPPPMGPTPSTSMQTPHPQPLASLPPPELDPAATGSPAHGQATAGAAPCGQAVLEPAALTQVVGAGPCAEGVGTTTPDPATATGRSSAMASSSSLSPFAIPFRPIGNPAGRPKARRWAEDNFSDDSDEETPPAATSSPYLDAI